MKKNRLGRTDLELSHLSFGGIKLRKGMADGAENIVGRALDLGMNYLDTARDYGDSEVLIGAVMKERRGECYLSSKFMNRAKKRAAADINTSLSKLHTEMIDIYFCHDLSRDEDYEQAVSERGVLAAVQAAQKAGKIRYVAVSTHRKETALKAIRSGEFDVIMLPVNLFDQDFIADVVPAAREAGIGIVGMKPLVGGAFQYPEIALRYSLAQDIDVQLVGISSLAELEQDVRIAEDFHPLSKAEMGRLLDDAKELGKDFCRQCGYCLPCTAGIDIPTVFLYERYAKRFWLDDVARERYAHMAVRVDACTECGTCEERCPYELPIIKKLAAVHKLLTSG